MPKNNRLFAPRIGVLATLILIAIACGGEPSRTDDRGDSARREAQLRSEVTETREHLSRALTNAAFWKGFAISIGVLALVAGAAVGSFSRQQAEAQEKEVKIDDERNQQRTTRTTRSKPSSTKPKRSTQEE